MAVISRLMKPFMGDRSADDAEIVFRPERLKELAADTSYRTAEPYPNVIIDDFFEPAALDRLLAEWPDYTTPGHERRSNTIFSSKKIGMSHFPSLGKFTRMFLHRMSEPDFIEALEGLTGIWGLIPDPYLFGAGLHQTQAGGKLSIHADFNRHFKLPLDRRVNILLYLNRGWTEENAGWFEMWDRDMTNCVKRVLPIFNRMAIFSTTDFSYHGQPEEIVGPPTLYRRSIALYYYTVGRPAEEITEHGEHSTLWRERPGKGF